MLETERAYFNAKLEEWLTTNSNKFVVVKGEQVLGFFDTIDEALSVGARACGLQPFLVRRIERQREDISIPALTLGILNANTTFPA
jgi:hypothetical protein